jgi:hypothetical protein
MPTLSGTWPRRSPPSGAPRPTGTGFPAVEKNADRILASVKMLELNVTDVVELT